MKRRFTALLAGLCLALGLITTATAPSQAAPAVSTGVQNQTNACYQNANLPTEVNGCKFWTGTTICVDGSGINGQYYPVAAIAQMWNNVVDYPQVFALDYSDDCVADLYTPSLRMVVGGYHGGTTGTCLSFTNRQTSIYQNFRRWTNGPGVYINMDRSDCVGSQFRRNHHVSRAIGYLLGLEVLSSPGWSGRVMYNNPDLVQYPDAGSASTLRAIYRGDWGS